MSCTIPAPAELPPIITGCPAVTGTCPVPDAATTTSYAATASATVSPPTPVDESCGGAGGKTTQGGSGGTSAQVNYVPVAGPAGPMGPCGKGFDWRNEWAADQIYFTWTEGEQCNASVVIHEGSTYVCIQTHGADTTNEPGQFWSDDWKMYWNDFTQEGAIGLDGITGKLKSLLNGNFKDILDWSDWSIGDWVKTIAGVAAAAWVGSKVVDMMDSDGEVSTGAADFRYSGSPGYAVAQTPPTLKDVLTRLCLRAGLNASQFDVSQMPDDQLVYGAALTGTTTDILTSLKYIYGFDIVKATQKLIFIPYDLDPVVHIPIEDMGFEVTKSNLSRKSNTRLQSNDLPKKVTLTFKSPNLYYHEDQEKSELFTYKTGQDTAVSLPFVLTNQQAKDIAERALVQAHAQANTTSFTLPYKYMNLQPGDNITTDSGALRILTIDENPNNVLNITAVGANEISYALQSSGQPIQTARTQSNKVLVPGFTAGILLDLPPLDAKDNEPRLYAAVHGYNDENWPGCQVYETRDGGATYDVIASSSRTQSVVGIVDTKIGAVADEVAFQWDKKTKITVRLKTGQLISAPTDLSVYNGTNLCLIGSELIAFKNAELISTDASGIKTYELTTLLRGLRGTDWAISTHVDQELFVLIDDSLMRLDFPLNERGRERTYRFVTNGSDPSVTADQKATPYMINLLPWRVSHPTGSKIGATNDYGFTWTERPSFDNELQDFRQATRDISEWGGWLVAVLNPNDLDDEPKYTEFVYETNWTFTEAQQIATFGAIQDCVYVRVITMSRKVGGGYARTICTS